jgi:hypothetical protein
VIARRWAVGARVLGAAVLGVTVLGAAVLGATPAGAQAAIDSASTGTRAVSQGLGREVAAVAARGGVAWVGYRVPMIAGPRQMCCGDAMGGRCPIEGGGTIMNTDGETRSNGTRVVLDPPTEFLVLARIDGNTRDTKVTKDTRGTPETGEVRVTRIRTFTPDCEIDAGGMAIVWLTGVAPDESIAWLTTLVESAPETGDRRERVAKPAIAAIALHNAPAADRALESLVAPARPDWMRGDTAFWLGSSRGERGVRALTRMIAQDPSDKVREKAVFGVSVSRSPAALPALIATAKDDKSGRVRSQALFWLAHKAGQQAVATISNAITNDPDTEVKKKAVFALSQLPKDEGVPKLIEVARTNRNPEVRKQAMFWLGESKDARAVKFFEEILAR